MHRLIAHVLAAGALLALVLIARPAVAEEQILSYDVIVNVEKDGTFDVSERIRVRAEGLEIRHGIYRDFPVTYRLPSGFLHRVGFDVTGVERDGHPEPWHTASIDNFVRVYIGDAGTLVSPGEHDYLLRYRTTNQVRYFADHDEVYWNATGNFWSFPILVATARIDLPPGARITSKAAYVGAYGASLKDWRIIAETDNSITFQTTRALKRYNGLTVAVGFPKGIVPEPSASDLWMQSVRDNFGMVILIAAVVGVGLYFLLTWLKIGRDPPKGTIIPLFAPPKDMSPGLVSYLFFQGFDNVRSGVPRAFVAAIMDMAVKGNITIVDNGDDIELRKAKLSYTSLSRGESAIADRLFSLHEHVKFIKSYGKTLFDAVKEYRRAILVENGGVYFRNNYAAFALGIMLSVAAIIAYFLLQNPTPEQLKGFFPPIIVAILIWHFFAYPGRLVLGWIEQAFSSWSAPVRVAVGLIAALAAVLLGRSFLPGASLPFPAQLGLALLVMLNVSFFYLLRAPTVKGRKVMDDIEGFKLYLSVAEEGRLNAKDEPDMSQQLFERFLPYAVALGVEEPWTRAFSKWMAAAHPDVSETTYAPNWYSGHSFNTSSINRATTAMVTGLAAGMVAAMPSQTSSGSSGGGFSGGGGGGGGGGGW